MKSKAWTNFSMVLIAALGLMMIWLPLSLHNTYMNSEDLSNICSKPFRTPLFEVLDTARSLGFLKPDHADSSFDIFSQDVISKKKVIAHGTEEGYVVVSKSFLPPLMKQSCQLKFRNEHLVSSKQWISF